VRGSAAANILQFFDATPPVVTSGCPCLHMQHPSSLPPGHASEFACAERLNKVTGFRRSNNLTTTPVDHGPQPRGRPPTSSQGLSFCQDPADWISEVPRLALPQVYSGSSCVRLRYLYDPYTLLGSSNCMQPTRWSLRHHFVLLPRSSEHRFLELHPPLHVRRTGRTRQLVLSWK